MGLLKLKGLGLTGVGEDYGSTSLVFSLPSRAASAFLLLDVGMAFWAR